MKIILACIDILLKVRIDFRLFSRNLTIYSDIFMKYMKVLISRAEPQNS